MSSCDLLLCHCKHSVKSPSHFLTDNLPHSTKWNTTWRSLNDYVVSFTILWLHYNGEEIFMRKKPSSHLQGTVYPKKYAHGHCFAVLCCGYTLTDFPISIRLTSLALWQSNDCPSASKATLMNMDKYLMWIHYERLHNHIKAKHNKTVCIFLGIYCMFPGYVLTFVVPPTQPFLLWWL